MDCYLTYKVNLFQPIQIVGINILLKYNWNIYEESKWNFIFASKITTPKWQWLFLLWLENHSSICEEEAAKDKEAKLN